MKNFLKGVTTAGWTYLGLFAFCVSMWFIDCLGDVTRTIVVAMKRPAARHDARRTIATDFELAQNFVE